MVLEFIKEQMENLEVPYRFWEWVGNPPQTYFVGEYTGTDAMSESGEIQGEFVLSGFSRSGYADLLTYNDKIYKRFRNGERIYRNGKSAVVCYSHSLTVPSDLEGVKRLEIYLNTHEWSE